MLCQIELHIPDITQERKELEDATLARVSSDKSADTDYFHNLKPCVHRKGTCSWDLESYNCRSELQGHDTELPVLTGSFTPNSTSTPVKPRHKGLKKKKIPAFADETITSSDVLEDLCINNTIATFADDSFCEKVEKKEFQAPERIKLNLNLQLPKKSQFQGIQPSYQYLRSVDTSDSNKLSHILLRKEALLHRVKQYSEQDTREITRMYLTRMAELQAKYVRDSNITGGVKNWYKETVVKHYNEECHRLLTEAEKKLDDLETPVKTQIAGCIFPDIKVPQYDKVKSFRAFLSSISNRNLKRGLNDDENDGLAYKRLCIE